MRQSRPKRGVPGCVIIHPGGYGWCPGCEIILWRRLVFFIGVFINILSVFTSAGILICSLVSAIGGLMFAGWVAVVAPATCPVNSGAANGYQCLGCAKSLPCRSFVLNSPENGKKVWCVAELIPLKWALLKAGLDPEACRARTAKTHRQVHPGPALEDTWPCWPRRVCSPLLSGSVALRHLLTKSSVDFKRESVKAVGLIVNKRRSVAPCQDVLREIPDFVNQSRFRSLKLCVPKSACVEMCAVLVWRPSIRPSERARNSPTPTLPNLNSDLVPRRFS